MTPHLAANILSLAVYPLIWLQITSGGKRSFLFINAAACALFASVYWLLSEPTAAAISLVAAFTSMSQAWAHKSSIWSRVLIAALSIGIAVWVAPPDGLVGYLAVISYIWTQIASALRESVMRTMNVINPFIWIMISVLASAWLLIPADMFAAWLMMNWLIQRIDRAINMSGDALPGNEKGVAI